MIDISGITNSVYTANSLSNLILATPVNTGYQAMVEGTLQKSFLFHYEGEQSVSLESDITDHYSESNESISDHIATRPERYTAIGYIGELNNVPPEGTGTVTEAVQKLVSISGYVPELTITALRAYNLASQAYQGALAIEKSLVSKWGNGEPEDLFNKQQKAFHLFYGYWKDKRLFTLQTPWNKFDNMAIEAIRAVQSEDTEVVTNFEITFKKMRFANEIKNIKTEQKSGRADGQSKQGAGVDKGVVNASETSVELTSILP